MNPQTPKTQEEIDQYNQAEHARIALELLGHANIPRVYRTNSLDFFRKYKAWAKAFDDLAQRLERPALPRVPGAIVVLCGTRGCGKTAMATEILRRFASHHWRLFFSSTVDLVERCRNKDADFFEEISGSKLLVLDEFAKTGGGAWEESQLFNVLNLRSLDQKHTLLTCAASPKDLPTLLAPSLLDRINQPPSAILHLNWPSFR
jgi:DNA replication protein DnaC